MEQVDPESSLPENSTVLNHPEIRRQIDEDIYRLSSDLIISKSEASTLLIHHNWSVSSAHDAWLVDKEIREKVGLFDKPVINLPESDLRIQCEICFKKLKRRKIRSASCGHPFCVSCWRSYISTAVSNGPGCLNLKCPHPSSCAAAVSLDMIEALATGAEKEKYDLFLVNSFWNYTNQAHQFCWNCSNEAHRPVDCETMNKWNLKNNCEAETVNYILAFTKPCPKCKNRIEKNQGCNRMTCSCGHEFCWICLLDWSVHGYNGICNGYPSENLDEEIQKKNVRIYLDESYALYFEHFETNDQFLKKAVEDLKQVEEEKISELSRVQELCMVETKFLIEAWERIVCCRRVLKWTCVYGYYLPKEDVGKKDLFEYVKSEAESTLERLLLCCEKEVESFIEEKSVEFFAFKKKLSELTVVTRNCFRDLVTALENGLSDMKSGSKRERTSCSSEQKKRTKKKKRV